MTPGNLVDEAHVIAVEDRAVDGLLEVVEEALHIGAEFPPELTPARGEPTDLGTEQNASVGGSGSQQPLRSQRADDSMRARAREADTLGELREAEPLWLVLERSQDVRYAGDNLDTALTRARRRPFGRCRLARLGLFDVGPSRHARRSLLNLGTDDNVRIVASQLGI